MSKTYRAWNPDQDWLLPPSPRDWLPDGDLVYFMLDVVRTLDLSAITRKYEKEDRGFPPYHPRMMVTLLLYSYCVGVYSSRRIQKRCERDAAYRVLVGEDVPNFRTISDFRKLHLPELQGLFVEVLKLCAQAGLDEQIGAFDADTGYFSEENVSYLEGEQIDPHIATERLKHHEKIPLAPKGRIPKDLTAKQRMARKLRTKKGRETYAKRKGMIEPIFGQIKHARGFRQFLLRGMEKMRGEWRLLCLTHNLLKLFQTRERAMA